MKSTNLTPPPCGKTWLLLLSFDSRCQFLCLATAQAVNVAGVGPFSEAVLCQTPCSVPAAVNSIYALKESDLQRYETSADTDEDEEDEDSASRQTALYSPSTCLGICWDPPCNHGSEITSYSIDLGERQPIVIGPVTRYIIQHLQPDTSYRLVFCNVLKKKKENNAKNKPNSPLLPNPLQDSNPGAQQPGPWPL